MRMEGDCLNLHFVGNPKRPILAHRRLLPDSGTDTDF